MTEQEIKERDERIADYKQVEEFLAHPAVKKAIGTVNERYISQLREDVTTERLVKLHARIVALDDLSRELIQIMAVGKTEQTLKTRDEEKEAIRQKGRDKK